MHDRAVLGEDLVPHDVVGQAAVGLVQTRPDHPGGEDHDDGDRGGDRDGLAAARAGRGAAVAVVEGGGVVLFGQFGAPGVIILIPG